jgi:hypothetical protein
MDLTIMLGVLFSINLRLLLGLDEVFSFGEVCSVLKQAAFLGIFQFDQKQTNSF